MVSKLYDLALRRGGGCELVAADHQKDGFGRLGDEFRASLLELGVHRVAFGLKLGSKAGARGRHVPVEAALLVLQGGMCCEVGVLAGLGFALGGGQDPAFFAGIGDPVADEGEGDEGEGGKEAAGSA